MNFNISLPEPSDLIPLIKHHFYVKKSWHKEPKNQPLTGRLFSVRAKPFYEFRIIPHSIEKLSQFLNNHFLAFQAHFESRED
jgi:hypothetical protein